MTLNINDLTFDEVAQLAESGSASIDPFDPDPTAVSELVQADVVVGLRDTFPPTDGFQIMRNLAVMDAENDRRHRIFTVPWVYGCTHAGPIGDLGDGLVTLQATNAEVLVEGVTTVRFDHDAEVVQIRRYVDWNLILSQIGVSVAYRGAPVGGAVRRDFMAAADAGPIDLTDGDLSTNPEVEGDS